MPTLIAFHSKPAEKAKILKQLRTHAKADEIIQGQYWENGRGCAVGCTLHGSNHADYEPKFGIPQVLARLEDRIFEGLPNAEAKKWPITFMSAIKPGADLSDVWPQFAIWLLADSKKGVIRFAKTDAQRAVIDGVAELYRQRIPYGDPKWALARNAAYAAAAAAAAYAADAAATTADAYAAAYAAAATTAAADARKIHWKACAAKLLELLAAAPVRKAKRAA
jgi:hypothetical protein